MVGKRIWAYWLPVAMICIGIGLFLVAQWQTQQGARQEVRSEDWELVVADLIDSNARLREEIEELEIQLNRLEDVEGSGPLMQLLVNEVNNLRIANGQVVVSGPGIEVTVSEPIEVLDLHDLINELRNAGAEAIALNGKRIVAWTAISSDGQNVTVDGQPVEAPYRLEAIGDPQALDVALSRPGGLVSLLVQARGGASIALRQRGNLTLPVSGQQVQFAHAKAVD
jgi:uncharacterized protein YlxW (UPF0749 family)